MSSSTKPIFVFGSNLSGIHGAGAALDAHTKYGAQLGVGVGRTGNSYALPTKGLRQPKPPYLRTLPLERVKFYADQFIAYAKEHTELTFQLTAVGCGLAGFKCEQIAPLFAKVPTNVLLPPEWEAFMPEFATQRFWQYGAI